MLHAASPQEATEGWPSDPRLEALGQRSIQSADATPSLEGTSLADAEEFRRWRIEHGVAEGDSEMPSGELHF